MKNEYTLRGKICSWIQKLEAGEYLLWIDIAPNEIVGVARVYGKPIQHVLVPVECWEHVRVGATVRVTVVFEPAPSPGVTPDRQPAVG
jgi:uncharacterized OB-fold protein